MTHDELVVLCKSISLLLFMAIFIGTTIWAYWPSNKAKLEALAAIPLQDD